jgi:hypothetical protein
MQAAVDAEHHLIIAHDVISIGNDRAQLARMSKLAKETLEVDTLDVVADRGTSTARRSRHVPRPASR